MFRSASEYTGHSELTPSPRDKYDDGTRRSDAIRAHDFITEDQKRRPEISLRHLNHLKQINRARAASRARQATLKKIMYGNPAREHERLELEKARLELEQQKVELAATRAVIQAKTIEAINNMADAGAKANQKGRAKVRKAINDLDAALVGLGS